MYYYAQINENGECIGVSDLDEKEDRENLIPIPTLDTKLIGYFYNNELKEWFNIPESPQDIVPDIPIRVTQLDRIESQLIELQQIVTTLLSNN